MKHLHNKRNDDQISVDFAVKNIYTVIIKKAV